MVRDLRSIRVGDLLDDLAASDPAPGSGAVAALVVAASASLLAGAARASRPAWPEAGGVVAQAALLRTRAIELAEEVADAYARALAVLEAPAGESGEERDASIAQALSHAANLPLEISKAAGDAAALGVLISERGDPATHGDATAAALLAAGAARAAASLVQINLTAMPGDPRIQRANQLAEDAGYAARRTLDPGSEALH